MPAFQQWSCINYLNPLCADDIGSSSCYSSGDAVDCYVPYYDPDQMGLMSSTLWAPSNSCEGIVLSYADGKATVKWSANISISSPAKDFF